VQLKVKNHLKIMHYILFFERFCTLSFAPFPLF